MEIARIDVKVSARFDRPYEAFLPVLHDWVARGALGEIWVDVAPYLHVSHGPCVVAVAHHGLYVLDERDGVPGIRYQTRRPRDPERPRLPVEDRVAEGVGRVLAAARALREACGDGAVVVDPMRWTVGIPDRLAAPPDDEVSWAEGRVAVERAVARALGAASVRCTPDGDARRGLRWHVTAEGIGSHPAAPVERGASA